MYKSIRIFLFCLLLAFSLQANGAGVADLRCEYLRDPVGIDVAEPRFSWKLDSPEPVRGLKQTAYRILVASSEA
ncbi:MAG TPA: hypothetical protein VJ952_08775, partial [Opitutales bacterium]|nr:hypothetical protein [Opitutales bacterium]